MSQEFKVVITDYDYGDVDVERSVIEGAGFELVAAQCKSEEELIEVAQFSAVKLNQPDNFPKVDDWHYHGRAGIV